MVCHLSTGLRMCLISLLLFGVAYPLAVTLIDMIAFPIQSHGSLVIEGTTLRGSALIGQGFTGERYLHPRPSAAGAGYDGSASGGSCLGPTSRTLATRVAAEVERTRSIERWPGPVPVDLVTASGSGLDPDISPASALLQAPRIARARHLGEAAVRGLISRHIAGRQFAVLGEPRVNVLETNLDLDRMQGRAR